MISKHQKNNNFENLIFDSFLNQENILTNNSFDPDSNFFNENIFQTLNANYFSEEEAKFKLSSQTNKLSFSILHLNIRSMNKNFENFKLFLSTCAHEFSMICLTETWNSDELFQIN